MNELYSISIEREISIFFELMNKFITYKKNEQLMQVYSVKGEYSKWMKTFYERNDNICLFLFTETLNKYLSDNKDSLSDQEKEIIKSNGIEDVYDVLYDRTVKEIKSPTTDNVQKFIKEITGMVHEFGSWGKIPRTNISNYFDRVFNLCNIEELCCFIDEFKKEIDKALKKVDPLYYCHSTEQMFLDVERAIKTKVINNKYGMYKIEPKMSTFELMSLAVQKAYDANPNKRELIDEYVDIFKHIAEETHKKEDGETLPAKKREDLSKDKNYSECLKRNLKTLSFTKSKILAERKRLLHEIKDQDAKTVILLGDSKIISNVLFDYKLGKGYVLAPELEPIFDQVDFAIKEFANEESKVLTLYRYCKKKNIKTDPEMFCGCSKEEALSGSTRYPGSTFDRYVAIGYFPNSRLNKTENTKNGNVGSFEQGTFKAHNNITGQDIDDFRVISRREKGMSKEGKAYVKKA